MKEIKIGKLRIGILYDADMLKQEIMGIVLISAVLVISFLAFIPGW